MKYLILTTATASAPVLLKNADKINQLDVVLAFFLLACFFASVSVLLSEWRSPFVRLITSGIWAIVGFFGFDLIKEIWAVDKDFVPSICIGFVLFLIAEKFVNHASSLFAGLDPIIEKITKFFQDKLRQRFPKISKEFVFEDPKNEAELKILAVHEVGHGIVAAALEHYNIKLEIYEEVTHGTKGRCYHSYSSDHNIINKSKLEIDMLIALAGQEAEKLFFNEFAVGGTEDFLNWSKQADVFFCAGFSDEPYFPEPAWGAQENINARSRQKLLKKHRQALAEFLSKNKPLIDEVSEILATKKKLNWDELKPYFARIDCANTLRYLTEDGIPF